MNRLAAIRQAFQRGCERDELYSSSPIGWWVGETAATLEEAFAEAATAAAAAERLDWQVALRHARRACRLETQEFGKCRWWRPLHQAIEAAGCETAPQSANSNRTQGV